VNTNYEVVYQAEVFRPFGSYRVNRHSFAKHGITSTRLQESSCKPLDTVLNDLRQILNNKLVIGLSLAGDFSSLDLSIKDFDAFDLQWHFYSKEKVSSKVVNQPLGLRSLCMHFFNYDCQPPRVTHTAEEDAITTMKLFQEVYVKLEPTPIEMTNEMGTNEIPRYK